MGSGVRSESGWLPAQPAPLGRSTEGLNCATHAGLGAVARCLRCGQLLCPACRESVSGRHYCAAHAGEARALGRAQAVPVAWSRDDLADVWTRAIAMGIDATALLFGWATVCLVVLWLISVAAVNWFCTFAGVTLVLLVAAYFTLLVGRYGQTIGQSMLGLRVLGTDGLPVPYGRAFLRCLGSALCVATALAGFLLAAYDGNKQGLHDKLANTVVVGPRLPVATKVWGSLLLAGVMAATVAALTPLLSLTC